MEVKSLHIVNKEMDVVVMGGSREKEESAGTGFGCSFIEWEISIRRAKWPHPASVLKIFCWRS